MQRIHWKELANLRSMGDCVILIADYSVCVEDPRVRDTNATIAARSRVPIYAIYFDQKSPDMTAMQQFIMKVCPPFKVTNRWKLFTIKGGQPISMISSLPDAASIDEIFRPFYPATAPPISRQPMMSISTGSGKPAQIMGEDRRLAEPEDFIPYNQEWRKIDPH